MLPESARFSTWEYPVECSKVVMVAIMMVGMVQTMLAHGLKDSTAWGLSGKPPVTGKE